MIHRWFEVLKKIRCLPYALRWHAYDQIMMSAILMLRLMFHQTVAPSVLLPTLAPGPGLLHSPSSNSAAFLTHEPPSSCCNGGDIILASRSGHNKTTLEATPLSALAAIQDVGSSSSAMATLIEKEFFPLTAKKVLEEISTVHSNEHVHSEITPAVKRILSFEETQENKDTSMGAIQPVGCSTTTEKTTLANPLPKDPVQISPSKKTTLANPLPRIQSK